MFWVFHSSLTGLWPISVPPPLYRRFYLTFTSSIMIDLWSIEDTSHHTLWWVVCFGYLRSENINHTIPVENVSSPHPTSRRIPGEENPNRFTILIDAGTRWKVSGPLWGFTCTTDNDEYVAIFMLEEKEKKRKKKMKIWNKLLNNNFLNWNNKFC